MVQFECNIILIKHSVIYVVYKWNDNLTQKIFCCCLKKHEKFRKNAKNLEIAVTSSSRNTSGIDLMKSGKSSSIDHDGHKSDSDAQRSISTNIESIDTHKPESDCNASENNETTNP